MLTKFTLKVHILEKQRYRKTKVFLFFLKIIGMVQKFNRTVVRLNPCKTEKYHFQADSFSSTEGLRGLFFLDLLFMFEVFLL